MQSDQRDGESPPPSGPSPLTKRTGRSAAPPAVHEVSLPPSEEPPLPHIKEHASVAVSLTPPSPAAPAAASAAAATASPSSSASRAPAAKRARDQPFGFEPGRLTQVAAMMDGSGDETDDSAGEAQCEARAEAAQRLQRIPPHILPTYLRLASDADGRPTPVAPTVRPFAAVVTYTAEKAMEALVAAYTRSESGAP